MMQMTGLSPLPQSRHIQIELPRTVYLLACLQVFWLRAVMISDPRFGSLGTILMALLLLDADLFHRQARA